MATQKRTHFTLYVDSDLALQIREAARQHHGGISGYLKDVVEKTVRRHEAEPDRLTSGVEFNQIAICAVLEHLSPPLLKKVQQAHRARMARTGHAA